MDLPLDVSRLQARPQKIDESLVNILPEIFKVSPNFLLPFPFSVSLINDLGTFSKKSTG